MAGSTAGRTRSAAAPRGSCRGAWAGHASRRRPGQRSRMRWRRGRSVLAAKSIGRVRAREWACLGAAAARGRAGGGGGGGGGGGRRRGGRGGGAGGGPGSGGGGGG